MVSDNTLLVRAILLVSSALDNLDNIPDEFLVGKMRRDYLKFDDWFCHHTNEFTIAMAEHSWESYDDTVHYWFDGVGLEFESFSEKSTELILFVSKVKVALGFLNQISSCPSLNLIVKPLISRIEFLLKSGYMRKTNISEENLGFVCNHFKTLGEKIISD